MKHFKGFTLIFSTIVILLGFYQLNNERDIFAQSKQHCCNRGQCQDANCTAQSSIDAGSTCKAYLLTCKDCIDLEYSGCLDNCSSDKNIWCNNNGVNYYGTIVLCLDQK